MAHQELSEAQAQEAGVRRAVDHLIYLDRWEAAETVAELVDASYVDHIQRRYEREVMHRDVPCAEGCRFCR